MTRYHSIFYKGDERYYPVYEDDNGKFWLGGSGCHWIIFGTKAEAEQIAKKIRKQKLPFFEKGTIIVNRARLEVF